MLSLLSVDEKVKLSHLEAKIERGLRGYLDAGQALLEIHTAKLWRAEYDTFEEYCSGRWHFDRTHAYRLMDAAKIVKQLSPIGDTERLPKNEGQARELRSLPNEERISAWQEVLERAEKPTAKIVKEVVADRKQRKLEPKQQAIVSDPEHPLFGETVTVSRVRGDEITAQTSAGEQVLFTPELQAIDPLEALKQRSGLLESMIRRLVQAIKTGTINPVLLDEAARLAGEA